MRQVALLAFDMRIFLQYLRGLRESGLLFMNRLHDNNSRIFRSQIQEKRTAVFHHGNKLLVSDPGRIKEDIITKMPDFIHDLTGIIYAAVIIAKLDNGCPERPVHHGTLGVSFRNQHAYILFIEAMIQHTANKAERIPCCFQINRNSSRLYQCAIAYRFMVVSFIKNQISWC